MAVLHLHIICNIVIVVQLKPWLLLGCRWLLRLGFFLHLCHEALQGIILLLSRLCLQQPHCGSHPKPGMPCDNLDGSTFMNAGGVGPVSLAGAASGGLVAGPLTYSHSCALKTCTYKEAADRRMDPLIHECCFLSIVEALTRSL